MEENQASSSAVGSNHEAQVNSPSCNDESDDASSRSFTSPGSTTYWLPICSELIKPRVGQCFPTFEEGLNFYKEYGRICGFDVRRNTKKKSSDRRVLLRYIVCNREGFSEGKSKSTEDNGDDAVKRKRKTKYSRCGCGAKLALKLSNEEGVYVYIFKEHHNHMMAEKEGRQFLKSSRKISIGHKSFAFDASKVKIGAARAHSLMKELVGGYENVGATVRDFRNWTRDIKQGIGEKDAQIILDKFKVKKEQHAAFYYEYEADDLGHLTKLFWSDPIARRNYEVFGDVISFDATFRTNKYNMVFVPFCGVDNHRKCVTFAAGLLSREDIVHYTWIFEAFLKCMGREPLCIITDQCPAMKQAIPAVFTSTRHRWCMWHIMNKLPVKVGPQLCVDAQLSSKIKGYVWDDSLTESQFEEGWNSVMKEFKLKDNEWLTHMYENRRFWIPTYFRDDPLLGILRTTSWSESMNAFFGQYNMEKDTLTEFYVRFETAMAKQRQTTRQLNHECLTSLPTMETPLLIEKDAAELYTHACFYKVQTEIKESCFSLGLKSMGVDDSVKQLVVIDGLAKNRDFEVKHVVANNHIDCSCKLFERSGILCRHGFFALKLVNVFKIPRHLVLNRWTKNAERRVSSSLGENISADCGKIESFGVKVNDIWFDFNACMGLLGTDMDDFDHVSNVVKELKHYLRDRRGTNVVPNANRTIIQNLIGSEIPEEVTVKPPNESRNKCCGSKRIMSAAEKSIIASRKAKRLCRSYNQLGNHDKRNCPLLTKNKD